LGPVNDLHFLNFETFPRIKWFVRNQTIS